MPIFQIISVISIAFVVVSTIGMTLNTIPSIQHRNFDDEPIDNPKLALIEAICISWFTIEYLLRFAGMLCTLTSNNKYFATFILQTSFCKFPLTIFILVHIISGHFRALKMTRWICYNTYLLLKSTLCNVYFLESENIENTISRSIHSIF